MLPNSKELERGLSKLRNLIRRGPDSTACWGVGDWVARLLPLIPDGQRLLYLARKTRLSASRLSEYKCVAATFSVEQRANGTFQDSLLAYRIHRRMGQSLRMTALQIRREIEVECTGAKRWAHVRAHFVLKRREAIRAARSRPVPEEEQSMTPFDRCHHASWIATVPTLIDASVQLVFADPPYGDYYRCARASGLLNECDNNSPEESAALTLALFREFSPKLCDGGSILIFQAGMRPDNPDLLAEAKRQCFKCAFALTWYKLSNDLLPPRQHSVPFGVASERILVFVREGEAIPGRQHDRSASPDVLRIPPETVTAACRMDAGLISEPVHIFQKPAALCELLIEKLTNVGDVVVEPFGGMGTASLAAAKLGRRFIYIESNAANFEEGQRRLVNFGLPARDENRADRRAASIVTTSPVIVFNSNSKPMAGTSITNSKTHG